MLLFGDETNCIANPTFSHDLPTEFLPIAAVVVVVIWIFLRIRWKRASLSSTSYQHVGIQLIASPAEEKLLKNGGRKTISTQKAVIGFVVGNFNQETRLTEFRKQLVAQVPLSSKKFHFVFNEGWPISSIQENLLSLQHVINSHGVVQIREVKKSRFGVKTTTGTQVGFIFVEPGLNATSVRRHINKQLKDVLDGNDYVFIDDNGWPVTTEQEFRLKAADLIFSNTFTIKMVSDVDTAVIDYADDVSEQHYNDLPKVLSETDGGGNSNPHTMLVPAESNNKKLCLRENSNTSTTTATSSSSSSANEKNILISYVRSEAEHYARKLKAHLLDLGCSVFLDVDEIYGGYDWQDTLNNAVVNCDVFVPLITPQYGLTLWTNREIKLADTKNKLIVPVNFLDHWPPECLAIQFASTQYLSWKKTNLPLTADDKEPAWDHAAHQAAEDIVAIQSRTRNGSLVHLYAQAKAKCTFKHNDGPRSVLLQENVLTRSVSVTYKTIQQDVDMSDDTMTVVDSDKETELTAPLFSRRAIKLKSKSPKRPLIVILAGEDQNQFVDQLRNKLEEENFQTWTPLDHLDLNESGNSFDFNVDTVDVDAAPAVNGGNLVDTPEEYRSNALDLYFSKLNNLNGVSVESLPVVQSTATRNFPPLPLLPPRIHRTSECSDFSCSNDSRLSPEEIDSAKVFKKKVRNAQLVLMVMSSDYCKSKSCKREAFYCDYRKAILPVKLEDCKLPHWLSKIVDADLFVPRGVNKDSDTDNADDGCIIQAIVDKVKLKFEAQPESRKFENLEAKIQSLASFLTKKITQSDRKRITVFIAGSEVLTNPKSQAICENIGKLLAKVDNLCMVTSSKNGAARITRESFAIECLLEGKCRSHNLFHVLADNETPCDDSEDGFKQRTTHPSVGKTIHIGASECERNVVIAKSVRFCILIEGDVAAANIANEFMFYDNFVIPVACTGSAASGEHGCKAGDTQIPQLVSKSDWRLLKRSDANAPDVASAVVNIIMALIRVRNRSLERKPKGTKRVVEHRSRSRKYRNSKIAANYIF